MGSVYGERAKRAPSLGEGFVDISMYVVLNGRSKNAAGMRPDRLVRIFRKLRLAVFWRFCRLPIGRSSLLAGIGRLVSHFEARNVWLTEFGSGSRVGEFAVVAAPVMAELRPVFGQAPIPLGRFGKITGVACDPPGWTCVL
jgi:hypothetical protein